MVRVEVQGTEVAEEMEKERRMFQLQMCEVRGERWGRRWRRRGACSSSRCAT